MSRSTLPTIRREELIALAEEVAETHCPGQFIDPTRILEKKRISYSFNYYGNGFDGMLEHRRGRFHVYCNLDRVSNPTHPRARFTQGHELGHFFIDAHRNALMRGVPPHLSIADQVDPERTVEEEADLFSSHLLMPRNRFKTVLRAQPPGLKGIIGVGKEFGVSCSSAAIRVIGHTAEPLALVYWRNDKGPWTEVNPAFQNMGLVHPMRSANRLPTDCATALAMADNPNNYNDPRATVSVASFWFTGVYHGSAQDIMLHEEALRLGRFGVITVLRPFHK